MTRSLIILSLLCAGSLCLCGCTYDRTATNLAYCVVESSCGKVLDIPFWTEAFREKKGRLPRDFAELSRFVSRQTSSRVQLDPDARVDFAVLPSGQRQAVCYSVTDGVTNQSVMTWGKPMQ